MIQNKNFIGICDVPVKEVSCKATEVKFYFNQTSRTCQEFSYGGCGGNANRFSTVNECESVCLYNKEPAQNGNKPVVSKLSKYHHILSFLAKIFFPNFSYKSKNK